MTPFDAAQRLRILASQLENCAPDDTEKLQVLSNQLSDLVFELDPGQ